MTQSVYPVIAYKDVAAAIDWLSATFGFEVKMADKKADGTVGHAELRHGDSLLMLSEEGEIAPAGGCVYLHVPEIDAHYERARARRRGDFGTYRPTA